MRCFVTLMFVVVGFASPVFAEDDIPWNEKMCPKGIENGNYLRAINPYDTKGVCYSFGAQVFQLLGRNKALFAASNGVPFAMLDFGKNSAPTTTFSGVVLGKGAYTYETTSGAKKIVSSFVPVPKTKKREEWEKRKWADRKVQEEAERVAKKELDQRRRELTDRHYAELGELDDKKNAEDTHRVKWETEDIKLTKKYEDEAARFNLRGKELTKKLTAAQAAEQQAIYARRPKFNAAESERMEWDQDFRDLMQKQSHDEIKLQSSLDEEKNALWKRHSEEREKMKSMLNADRDAWANKWELVKDELKAKQAEELNALDKEYEPKFRK